MADYRPPVKDSTFALRHFGMLDRLAASELYGHADADTVHSILEESGRFFAEVFGPTNAVGDREGLQWSPEGVTTPESFKGAYRKYVEAGWQGINFDPAYGGANFPNAVYGAVSEFMIASNAALSMLPGLTSGAVELLEHWGTEAQKETYLPRMTTGEWSGTMNLTEPQAGSDVGLSTTRAVPQDDGTYRISGTKIFISFGEQDLTENIVHLVLARLPDAPPGTKGISLFLVPKFLVDDDGSLGERNDVRCVSIEHKMGIHASPTCVMSYGDEGGAVGELVGEENQGMRAMFTMMNAARLEVGVQGLAISEAAYQKAYDYSLERLQGKEVGGEGAGPVPIVVHPDVRRMLLFMRSHVEAMRNLLVFNAACLDMARISEGEDAQRWQETADLLTPVSKAWCTDIGVEVTSTAVQVFGGMGYIEESGVSQHFRDCRISPIYEGTNGIQAMDLVGRKLGVRMGATVDEHLARLREACAELRSVDGMDASADALEDAVAALEEATGWVMAHGLEDPRDALAGATPYLRMFGVATGGWAMARQAICAGGELGAATSEADQEYLRAKLTTARYYCEQHLPQVRGLLGAVTAGQAVLYDVSTEGLASA
jgi:alkylation response protein AidB-like acyl-CoA dehydrogenase